ncbi:MAG: hypothetical protein HYT76_06130 [Deltaproteobacteria bacterium]|nr:hypothetical protein [Deltaproteobacteria bacterium]
MGLVLERAATIVPLPEGKREELRQQTAEGALSGQIAEKVIAGDFPFLENYGLSEIVDNFSCENPYQAGGNILYLGYLQAQKSGKQDLYLTQLKENKNNWYSLLLSFMLQINQEEQAAEILSNYGRPEWTDGSLRDFWNKLTYKIQAACDFKNIFQPTRFQCTPLFHYDSQRMPRFTALVVVDDKLDPATYKPLGELRTYIEERSHDLRLQIIRQSDIKQNPRFKDLNLGLGNEPKLFLLDQSSVILDDRRRHLEELRWAYREKKPYLDPKKIGELQLQSPSDPKAAEAFRLVTSVNTEKLGQHGLEHFVFTNYATPIENPFELGGNMLYLGYLYAKSIIGRQDDYINHLMAQENRWDTLLLAYLIQIGKREEAKELLWHYGKPEELDSNTSDLWKEIEKKREGSCKGEGPTKVTLFQCSPLFNPPLSKNWEGLGEKYQIEVIVGDSYNPAELREVADYVKQHSGHIGLKVYSYSQVRHLAEQRSIDPTKLPAWRLKAYGHSFASRVGLPTQKQIEPLYEGMQNDNAPFSWNETRVGEMKIKWRPFADPPAIQKFVDRLQNRWENKQVGKNFLKLAGNLEFYLVPQDPSYKTAKQPFFDVIQKETGVLFAKILALKTPNGFYDPLHHRAYYTYAPRFAGINVEMFIHETTHAILWGKLNWGASSLPWLRKYFDRKKAMEPIDTSEETDKNEKYPAWPSPYSSTNAEEFLTECFTKYLMGGESAKDLKKTDPLIYEVANRFFNAEEPSASHLSDVEGLARELKIELPQVANVGWQGAVGIDNRGGGVRLSFSNGIGAELLPGLRGRVDLGAGVHLDDGSLELTLTPELGYQFTDNLMLAAGYSFGPQKSPENGGLRLSGEVHTGVKADIPFPYIRSELMIGVSASPESDKPLAETIRPFIGFQKRF